MFRRPDRKTGGATSQTASTTPSRKSGISPRPHAQGIYACRRDRVVTFPVRAELGATGIVRKYKELGLARHGPAGSHVWGKVDGETLDSTTKAVAKVKMKVPTSMIEPFPDFQRLGVGPPRLGNDLESNLGAA